MVPFDSNTPVGAAHILLTALASCARYTCQQCTSTARRARDQIVANIVHKRSDDMISLLDSRDRRLLNRGAKRRGYWVGAHCQ